jgi:predicted TIM-barrel fold metal-dependent hydrolase
VRIVDLHVHLAPPAVASEDPLRAAARAAYEAVRGRLPAPGRAALELAAGVAAPLEARLRDRAIDAADAALALGRNRLMYLGRLGERLAHGSAGLLEASFLRASPRNLLDAMDAAGVHAATVLPVAPRTTTDDALAAAALSPRLIPFCCPEPGTPAVGEAIAAWKARGCRGIKMHPTIQGLRPADPFWRDVASAAQALELPVVAHTGELDVGAEARHAAFSAASAYEPLLRDFPRARFVLAHMNLFRPDEAIDLARRYESVLLDTSWQPAGVVRRALRRLGESRLVFGSDWPFLGARIAGALAVVAAGLDHRPAALERVLGRNAEELLHLAW